MGSKRDRRAQKKREKDRKKRDAARKSRGSRQAPVAEPTGRVRGLSAEECSRWPLGDCDLSQNWHEHGPRVIAVLSRVHVDGRVAALFVEADLEGPGLTEVMFRGPVSADGVLGEVARRSEVAGVGVQIDDPLRIAKVILTAQELGTRGEDAAQIPHFLDDLDIRACPDEILTGTPPPPPPKKKSLFSFLFGS